MAETTLVGKYKNFEIRTGWSGGFGVFLDGDSCCDKQTVDECEKYIDGFIKRNSNFKIGKAFEGYPVDSLTLCKVTSISGGDAWISYIGKHNRYGDRCKIFVKKLFANSKSNKALIDSAIKKRKKIDIIEKEIEALQKKLKPIKVSDFFEGKINA